MDGADFSAIYSAEVSYVYNCLRRLGVAERDLEDKVQDVFVVVHRKLSDYDPTRPIRPWLTGIAARVALDHLRRAYQQREDLRDEVEVPGPEPGAEARLADRQAQQLVLDALERLAPERRAVFVLHEIEGHSMPEIAEMIDAPLNTLYSRLRLAREQFTAAARRLRAQRGER